MDLGIFDRIGGGGGGVAAGVQTLSDKIGSRGESCGICLEFREVAKYNGSPCVNLLSNNRRSCRCENFSVNNKKKSVREEEGGSGSPRSSPPGSTTVMPY